ncbi:MAG: phasin family protein [Paraglaciecola sp.]|jgi:phasin family protein
MFDKFSEEITTSAQPIPNLMEMNARTLELISKQQTLLSTGLMDDSVKLVENLTDQTELKVMLVAQSVFAESMRERITVASKTTYTQLADIHTELTKDGLTSARVEASVKNNV